MGRDRLTIPQTDYMKRYHITALFVITTLLGGCFRQDLSDCGATGNLILKPGLYVDGGSVPLAGAVNIIDAFVYGADNRPVAHSRVGRNGQNQFPEIGFTVVPGEYRVVCWGNITDKTEIVGQSFTDSYLETTSGVTGSPLYYAPRKAVEDRSGPISTRYGEGETDYSLYTVVVPPGKTATKEMLFTRAHRTVRIYLKDYEAVHGAAAPGIRVTNIPVRSDFFLRTDPSRGNYEALSTSVATAGGPRMTAAFSAMIAPITDDMAIEVINSSDGRTVTSFSLKRYVEDNADKIDDIDDFDIEIRYLKNGSVEITIPNWGDTPIEPEW